MDCDYLHYEQTPKIQDDLAYLMLYKHDVDRDGHIIDHVTSHMILPSDQKLPMATNLYNAKRYDTI